MRTAPTSASRFTQRAALALGAIALATLAACGGGDDDNGAKPSSTADLSRYVGTWVSSCVPTNDIDSYTVETAVTLTADNTLSAVDTRHYYYERTDCSGTPENQAWGSSQVTYQGTNLTNNVQVDKFLENFGKGDLVKVGYYSDGVTTYYGNDDDQLDAQGYPTALVLSPVMHRRYADVDLSRFVGDWRTDCITDSANTSHIERSTITLKGDQGLSVLSRTYRFAGSVCGGTNDISTVTADLVYTGTASLDGATAFQFTDDTSGLWRMILLIDNKGLLRGNGAILTTPQVGGYPTTLTPVYLKPNLPV